MGIDRTREDSDVIERVLGRGDEPGPRSEVIDVGIRPWLAGTVTSAVQLTIGAADDHRPHKDQAGAADDHRPSAGRAPREKIDGRVR